MKNLAVRNMYNGNIMLVPDNQDPNAWFKWIIIMLIVFLIIKILILKI